ncbi:MAG TPA: DUF4340 domain-containing protein [Vicinamibacterales bacterium]|nr:DUF4340 domain-containing protein [Vicinamibacterales bacterium]
MKGLRSFLVLLVIAAGLGGYLYYDSKREPGDAKKQEKVFAGVQSDKIEQVTVKSVAGDRTRVEKQGTAWRVTQPAPVPADEAELSGITSNLASAEIQRVVDDQATDFKQYGLDPPRIEVGFRFAGKDQRLLIGQKTPTGADLYARVPDKPRVFLLPSYLESTFNKSSFDLRDKTILKIDRERVDHVEIETSDQTVKLAKQGADWRLTAPTDARADFSAVEGIIGRLNTTPMKAIVAGDTGVVKDPKEYGLDKPTATVRVTSGSAQAGLTIGKSAGEGVFYAKDLSRPLVFTVEQALLDELKKPAGDFRIKDLFDARAFNTTRVEIVRNGQTLVFEKDKGKDAWKQTAPAQKAADTAKVEALLTALSNTRASSFVEKAADTGLDSPEVTIGVTFEDGQRKERVAFARKGTDAYARREGDASAAKIETSALDAISKAIDALK